MPQFSGVQHQLQHEHQFIKISAYSLLVASQMTKFVLQTIVTKVSINRRGNHVGSTLMTSTVGGWKKVI
jgi:hypothetical protein